MSFDMYRTPFLPDGFLFVKYDFIDENFLFWKNAVSMSPIAIAPPTTFAAIVVFAKNIVSQILIGNVIKRSYSFPSLFARLCLFEQFVRDAIKHPVGNGHCSFYTEIT